MATSKNSRPPALLPTPEALNHEGYQRANGKEYPRLGKIISTFSPGDSPVSLFPPQDEDGVRKTTATSGRRCLDLYAKHVLPSSWARTLAASLLGTTAWYSSKCSLIWKLRVTKSGRSLFQLAPLALPTGATGYGLLLTPSAGVHIEETPESMRARAKKNGYRNGTKWNSLASQVRFGFLPTATAGDYKGRMKYRRGNLDLGGVIKMLPTPRSADGLKGTRTEEGYKKEQARWGRKNGEDLPTAIATTAGSKTGLRLQPGFALWMMGYHPGWLDLEAGEMPPSRARATQSSPKSPQK